MNDKTSAEPPIQRRRRPWLLVAIIVFLAVHSNSWYFWPLNPMERRLVGDWSARTEVDSSVTLMTLRPNHTFTAANDGAPSQTARGFWQANDSGLFVYRTHSLKDGVVQLLRLKTVDVSWGLHLPKAGTAEPEVTLTSPWGKSFQRRK